MKFLVLLVLLTASVEFDIEASTWVAKEKGWYKPDYYYGILHGHFKRAYQSFQILLNLANVVVDIQKNVTEIKEMVKNIQKNVIEIKEMVKNNNKASIDAEWQPGK